jgi:hypothetical protein
MQPIWKVILYYENYSVSNTGLVKAFDGTVLKQQLYNNYLCVKLYNGTHDTWKKVHRLVADAFVDNPKERPVVNHLDYNTFNNHAYNLEWVTHKENVEYSKDRMTFNRYKVLQIDPATGKIVKEYESCAAAVIAMGGKNNGSAIAKAAKQGTKSYGYYWKRATTS